MNNLLYLQLSTPCTEGDFTGLRLISNKPVFVQSGTSKGWIKNDMITDHYADHILPVDRLGGVYVIIPTPTPSPGDILRIVGKDPK